MDERLRSLAAYAAAYQAAAPAERRQIARIYTEIVSWILVEQGLAPTALAPLHDRANSNRLPTTTGAVTENRSRSTQAGVRLLARAACTIDLLVEAGRAEDAAAQAVARQIVLSGLKLPDFAADPRAWRGLLVWRRRLTETRMPKEAWFEYERFRASLAGKSAAEVLSQRVWDLRASRSGAPAALDTAPGAD